MTLRRRIGFSLFAAFLFLGTAECGLRVAGFEGSGDRTTTWFSDHILLPPLWHTRTMDDPPATWMSAGQAHHFHPFAREPADDTFRIAVLGGSAAHGYGLLEPGAFPHRLEQLLQRAVPETEIQVVNMGTVTWSSQQILWANRSLHEVGRWDLIVIYSGNNELLELSSWKSYMPPGEHRRFTKTLLRNQRLAKLRLYRLLRLLLGKAEPPSLPGADPEPEATPSDDPNARVGGEEERLAGQETADPFDPVKVTPAMRLDDMELIPREERARIGKLERRYAARTFTHNIGIVVDLARQHDTPVIVMNPAPNDRHDPAFFPYAGEEGERFEALITAAQEAHGNSGGVEAAQAALKMKPNDPRAHFAMGNNLGAANRRADGLPHFIEARRWAEYPNRVIPEVSEAILDFEGRSGVLAVIDIEAVFRAMDPDGYIGYQLIYDHCHPSAAANWLIAGEVAEMILAEALLQPEGGEAPIDSWAAAGRTEMLARTAPDPRLWEWTGLRFGPEESVEYIADFQGDWNALRDAQEARVDDDSATAMDWLWAGNGRFYAYDLEAASEAWDRALRLDMGLCLAHANRARALRLVGARAAALEAANKAVACEPGNVEYVAERDLLNALTK